MSQNRLSEPATPLEQDAAVLALMDSVGMELIRLPERVVIEDAHLVPMVYTRRQPDKPAIRKALLDGLTVPGARLEYGSYLLVTKGPNDGATKD